MDYQTPNFTTISNIDLCNAVNNIDFLLMRMNLNIALYNILIRFRSDIVLELKKRGICYG